MGKQKQSNQSSGKNGDLIEFIYATNESNIVTEIVSRPTMDKLPRLIHDTLGSHFTPNQSNDNSVLFLDLHGVVDTVDTAVRLSDWLICVISFVGRSSRTREVARDDIAMRIASGQITCGCLVFERPKYTGSQIPTERLIGSKAWIINEYHSAVPFGRGVFVDDGEDHVQIVRTHCNTSVDCYLYERTDPDLPTYLSLIRTSSYGEK